MPTYEPRCEELEDESDEEAEYSFELEEVESENHIDMHTQELEVDEIMKDVFADLNEYEILL